MPTVQGLGGLIDNRSMQLAREALTGLSQRQAAVANNIANIDTPGFQRSAVDFEASLAQQMQRDGAAGRARLATTDDRHIALPTSGGGTANGGSIPRDVVSERNDANSVSIDEEMSLLAETQLRYQALTQTLGRRLSTTRMIIRGQ